jgi:hypothetical protein
MSKPNISHDTIDQKRRIIGEKTLAERLWHNARVHRTGIFASLFVVGAVGGITYFVDSYEKEQKEKIVPIMIWKQDAAICMTAGNEFYIVGTARPTFDDGRNSLYQKMNAKSIEAGMISREGVPSPENFKNLNVAFNIANEPETAGIISKLRNGTVSYDQKRPFPIIPGVERAKFGDNYTHKGKGSVNAIGYGGTFCRQK